VTEPTIALPEAYDIVQAAETSTAQTVIAKIATFRADIEALAASLPPQAGNSHVMQQIGQVTNYLFSFDSIADALRANYGPAPASEEI